MNARRTARICNTRCREKHNPGFESFLSSYIVLLVRGASELVGDGAIKNQLLSDASKLKTEHQARQSAAGMSVSGSIPTSGDNGANVLSA